MDDTNNGIGTLLHLLRLRLQNSDVSLQEVINKLLDEGSISAAVTENSGLGVSMLHSAIARGFTDDVRLLLERSKSDGRDLLNSCKHSGNSPLHVAANTHHEAVLELLIARGANINQRRWPDMYTALHVAALNGKASTVRKLLKHGADGAARNSRDNLPLHIAAGLGHCEVVKVLLECTASFDTCNYFGNTPLGIAALNDHGDVVELLLEHGANPNISGCNAGRLVDRLMQIPYPFIAFQLVRYGGKMSGYAFYKQWLEGRHGNIKEREMLLILSIILSGNDPEVTEKILQGARARTDVYPKPLRTWFHQNASGPCQLKFLCRQFVRHRLLTEHRDQFSAKIKSLPLPTVMTDFLMLSDMCFLNISERIVFRSDPARQGATSELRLVLETET